MNSTKKGIHPQQTLRYNNVAVLGRAKEGRMADELENKKSYQLSQKPVTADPCVRKDQRQKRSPQQ